MGWTKRQLVLAAFSEVGLASSEFDLTDGQIVDAANRLDAMMADWDARGVHLAYPITTPDSINLDADSNAPPWAVRAIVTNLACEVAPSYGREPMPATKANARAGLQTIFARMTPIPEMIMPDTMPAGAGNKPWLTTQNPFLQAPDPDILAGNEGEITFE